MGRRVGGGRGQLVLVAAALVAIALVPVVFGYLQLGAHPDVTASTTDDRHVDDAVLVLERAVHEAGTSVTGSYSWSRRAGAVRTVKLRLDLRREALASDAVEQGVVHRTAYNDTAASRWAGQHCPSGPDRQFGTCEARDGVVVQNRNGETHVLVVALDLTTITDRGRTELTLVIRTVGGTTT